MHDVTSSITQARHSRKVGEMHIGFECSVGQLVWLNGAGCNIGEDRLLLGREALLCHGFPVSKVEPLLEKHADEFTETYLLDVAANMTDLLVLTAVLSSALASVSWCSSRSEGVASSVVASTSDELEEASAFLSGLALSPALEPPKQKKRRTNPSGNAVARR